MFKSLREPRYVALSLLMLLIAVLCIGFGTWQISRFVWKDDTNHALRDNAHAATVGVGSVLSVYGRSAPPAEDAYKFRTITATGEYGTTTELVRRRSVAVAQSDTDEQSSENGYLVVTPFKTSEATLLVVRGFIPENDDGSIPTAPPSPTGTVTITARAMPNEARDDHARELTQHQLDAINIAQQATRISGPIFDGYATLLAGEPGSASLSPIPDPSLSNPAGGAIEPQHLAYIIQWYLFAALAIAAPFAMIRAEKRYKREDEDGVPDTSVEAKLADRYGR